MTTSTPRIRLPSIADMRRRSAEMKAAAMRASISPEGCTVDGNAEEETSGTQSAIHVWQTEADRV